MNILTQLLDTLPSKAVPVRQVVVGVHWTLVRSTHSGLASTMIELGPHGHSNVRDVGELEKKSAQELAGWLLSENMLEASIGLAAFNSLIEIDESRLVDINAAEVIAGESKEKNLAIIGHFPFVERMRAIAKNCWVIEKKPRDGDFPEEASERLLPQADVVAISGTTFINKTIEPLLALCRPSTLVMILGPSTPLVPLLFQYGATYLSGTRIIDEVAAVKTIQQGAAFPQVRGTRLVTITKG